MSQDRNRHYLIERMIELYLQHAWTDAQLAEELETDRTNIYKIRTQELEQKMGIPVEPVPERRGYYRINKEFFVANIRLTPAEMLALYLGGRRLQQQNRTSQKDVASALKKVADALHKPMSHNLVEAAEHILTQEQDERQAAILRTLVSCWIHRRSVHIEHQKLHGQVRKYLVSPYQLEPAVWGDGIYLIGYSDYHQGIASFKLSRILRATETTQPYKTPEEFDSHALLQHAWGIWHADQSSEPVKLKFNKYITPRVKETIWHPSQTIQETVDGGCIWQVEIAEWREMLPWVRGWGSDVEVLKPEEMREEVKKTAVRLSRQYKTIMATKLPYHIPYAKTNPDNREDVHLLLYHLIDVGQVTRVLWQDVLTPSIRQRLAQILNLDEAATGRFLDFLASLHDLGKAGPAYQRKYSPDWLKKELNDAGLMLQDVAYSHKTMDTKTPHATVSTWSLITLLPEMLNLDKRFARQIAVALGGHHGAWPPPGAEDGIDDSKYKQWDKIRRDLVWELVAVFNPPTAVSPPPDKTDLNTFLTIFSGLVSVADWLGSRNKECFGFVGEPMSTRQYAERAYLKAQESLTDLGWKGWQPTGEPQTFSQTFAYLNFEEPRPVQQQVIDAARDCPQPTLLILEAPTGIGKTETAVYLADTWLQKHHGRGLYVAMPTQATSNQMFGRFLEFLSHRYPHEPVNAHLVHGQAAWSDTLQEIELQSVGDDKSEGIAAMTWFKPRKRTLLAPFGVGTVDQTLLSILQTRHFFVRLFALSHKVVIFDEVHAYDTYMNTLFHRLLEWLNAIGTSVIILSATLPAATRRALVKAYSGQALEESKPAYPTLTIAASRQEPQQITLDAPKDYTVQLDWSVGREPQAIAAFLKEELVDGGCTAVICNTVRRAQDIYRALQDVDLGLPADDLILFHARFPPIWRQKIEKKVLAKFGKPDGNGRSPHRPHRAIVVATQVIEQSLDLDFDLMITDLAPIDLVLQRAGRLHRHKRDAAERYGHKRRLIITEPVANEGELPDFEADTYVYEPYILLCSYLALHDRQQITLPGETTDLIEAIYGSENKLAIPSTQWQQALNETQRKMEDNWRKAESKAKGQLILEPKNARLMRQSILGLEEDNPEVHQTFRAQTRDMDPGVSIICLYQNGEVTAVHDDKNLIPFDLEAIPFHLVKTLLQNMLTIQHRGVINALAEQPLPPNWQDNASLRHARPLLFTNNVCDLPDSKYYLKLTQTFGLEIIKKEAV